MFDENFPPHPSPLFNQLSIINYFIAYRESLHRTHISGAMNSALSYQDEIGRGEGICFLLPGGGGIFSDHCGIPGRSSNATRIFPCLPAGVDYYSALYGNYNCRDTIDHVDNDSTVCPPFFAIRFCRPSLARTERTPGKVANPARSQLNRENEYFPVPVRA